MVAAIPRVRVLSGTWPAYVGLKRAYGEYVPADGQPRGFSSSSTGPVHTLVFEVPRSFGVDRRDRVGGPGIRAFARSGATVVGLPLELWSGGKHRYAAIGMPIARVPGPPPTITLTLDGRRAAVALDMPAAPKVRALEEAKVGWGRSTLRLRGFYAPARDADSLAIGGVAFRWAGPVPAGVEVQVNQAPLGTAPPGSYGGWAGGRLFAGGMYEASAEASLGPVPRVARVVLRKGKLRREATVILRAYQVPKPAREMSGNENGLLTALEARNRRAGLPALFAR